MDRELERHRRLRGVQRPRHVGGGAAGGRAVAPTSASTGMRRARLTLLCLATLLVASPALAANTATFRWWWEGDTHRVKISPVNRAAVQAVLDKAAPGRNLYIEQGPGNLDADSTLWIHGNTHWKGSGMGVSTITRTRFNPADPAYHGDIINSSRWGMHTPNLGIAGNMPTDSLQSITIESVTLDGRSQSWASADPNGCNNFG